jgi:Cu/Ag efflux protein CusF
MSNHTIGFLCGLCLWTIGLTACSPVTPDASSPREYDVLGVIAELPEAGQSVVLSHETIPGFMQSMVMPFAVAESALLDGMEPGDDVWFHLVVREERATIDVIKKIPEFAGAFPYFRLKTQLPQAAKARHRPDMVARTLDSWSVRQ